MALQFEREFGCADCSMLVLSGIQQLEAANLLMSTPREAFVSIPPARDEPARRCRCGSAVLPRIAFLPRTHGRGSKVKADKPNKH